MQGTQILHRDALSYFNQDDLPTKVFLDKYALRNSHDKLLELTPDDMHKRIAREIARVEAKKFRVPLTIKQIYHCIKNFKYIIPQGGPMYGIGNPQYVTLSNCYVVQPPYDSYAGIHYTDEQITQISKRRGGVGTDISSIRPVGMATRNSSSRTTGIIPFAERFSNSIREVGQDGRRGALMLTLSVHHPEILNFASVKTDLSKVTGANLSVRLTDEFLEAVKNKTTYEQRWPVEGATPKVSQQVDATHVWNQIIHLAHRSAEPGILFWDHIIRQSPADCYADVGYRTVATNPCSELPLSILDSCRLLLLNLFGFVANPFTSAAKFLFKKFYFYAKIAQRLMDDIVDLELECIERIMTKIQNDPEPDYIKQHEIELWQQVYKTCQQARRTGTGITALGDVIASLGMQYASPESIKLTNDIYRNLKLACYESSVEMAEELGAFDVWNPEKEENNEFLLRIKDDNKELYERMQRSGRRNIALLTTPPAGTTSILAGPGPYYGTTSSGEPLFMMSFVRNKKLNGSDLNSRCDFVDGHGDRWQQFEVVHPKLRLWMDITGEDDIRKSPYYGSCAEEIDWKARVKMQGTAQQHIDHSISSTINLPENATEQDVSDVYTALWNENCKGGTVYRKNCRTGVLVEKKPKCPQCGGTIKADTKCKSCAHCGWGTCNV